MKQTLEFLNTPDAVQEFRSWLQLHGLYDRVGMCSDAFRCPVARWLSDRLRLMVITDGRRVTVLTGEKETTSIDAPLWIQGFVLWVDMGCEYGEFVSSARALQALEYALMARAREP